MEVSELETSLTTYEAQISQVNDALTASAGLESVDDLVQLKRDLMELVSLTKKSLLEVKRKQLLAELDSYDNKNPSNLEEEWIGRKCQAPFSLEYHNAVVFDKVDLHTVKVVFSHPTVRKMKPCRNFMNGSCDKDFETCPYSHGHDVAITDLRNFKQPQFQTLRGFGDSVLAENPHSGLWEHAQTVQTLEKEGEEDRILVEFRSGKDRQQKLSLEKVFPIEEGDGKNEEEEEEESSDQGMTLKTETLPINYLLDKIQGSASTLGDWEKHTKGIASKLMAKMGYVVGTGLGKDAQGRVEPIPNGVVYPQGTSLDFCIEWKQKKGQTTAQQQQQQRQQERKSKADEGQDKTSFFDFINDSLNTKQKQSDNKQGSEIKVNVKDKSERNLKVESFKLSEDESKLKAEIEKLRQSQSKHESRGDSTTVKLIQAKIKNKTEKLKTLNAEQRQLNKEQLSRSHRKKLSIF